MCEMLSDDIDVVARTYVDFDKTRLRFLHPTTKSISCYFVNHNILKICIYRSTPKSLLSLSLSLSLCDFEFWISMDLDCWRMKLPILSFSKVSDAALVSLCL